MVTIWSHTWWMNLEGQEVARKSEYSELGRGSNTFQWPWTSWNPVCRENSEVGSWLSVEVKQETDGVWGVGSSEPIVHKIASAPISLPPAFWKSSLGSFFFYPEVTNLPLSNLHQHPFRHWYEEVSFFVSSFVPIVPSHSSPYGLITTCSALSLRVLFRFSEEEDHIACFYTFCNTLHIVGPLQRWTECQWPEVAIWILCALYQTVFVNSPIRQSPREKKITSFFGHFISCLEPMIVAG